MVASTTEAAALFKLRSDAHFAVYYANRALVARGWNEKAYVSGRAALDGVLLDLAAAKWRLGRYDGTYAVFAPVDRSPTLRDAGSAGLMRVIDVANAITGALRSRGTTR